MVTAVFSMVVDGEPLVSAWDHRLQAFAPD
jgi:hypothetical protein